MRTIYRVMKRTAVAVGVLAAIAFAGLTLAGAVSAQVGSPAVGNPTLLQAVQQLQQQVAALQESLTATQGQLQAVQPRKFYMTTGVADGVGAPAACSAGFHMASLWEIHDTTGLRYDTAQGFVQADSGSGPPSNESAWIRTGNRARPGDEGEASCQAYTSNSTDSEGSVAALTEEWERTDGPSSRVSPWDASTFPCALPTRVWCVQD